MMRLIALSGYARTGKDTVGNYLVEHHGFTRVAFADALREAVYTLNPIVGGSITAQGKINWVRVQDMIDEMGWDAAKVASPEIRALQQRMGTEVGREQFWEDFWADVVELKVKGSLSDIVLTDCRFPNEAEMVKRQRGEVWRIERPGIQAVNAHVSETALDDWKFDRWVANGRDLPALYDVVDRMVASL